MAAPVAKHTFVSTNTEGTDATLVRAAAGWNADHDIIADSGTLVGRSTAARGAAEAITLAAPFIMASGTLGLEQITASLTGFSAGTASFNTTSMASWEALEITGEGITTNTASQFFSFQFHQSGGAWLTTNYWSLNRGYGNSAAYIALFQNATIGIAMNTAAGASGHFKATLFMGAQGGLPLMFADWFNQDTATLGTTGVFGYNLVMLMNSAVRLDGIRVGNIATMNGYFTCRRIR